MKTCSQCGQEYSDEKKYCLRCGIALEEQDNTGYLNCRKCGTQNKPDFTFCKKCGISLKEKIENIEVSDQVVDQPLKVDTKSRSKGVPEPSATALGSDKDKETLQRTQVQAGYPESGKRVTEPIVTEGTEEPYKGEELFTQYLRLAAAGTGTAQEGIALLNKALTLGLPLKDKVYALISIGNEFALLKKPDEAIKWHDHALELAGNSKEIFNSTSLRILCRRVCAGYILKSRDIKAKKGIDAALSYLLSKEGLLKTLCSPVLYLELAVLQKEKNPDDFGVISSYYNKVVNCEIIDELDESSIQKAKDALSILDKLLAASDIKIDKETTMPVPPQQKIRFDSSTTVDQPDIAVSQRSYMKFIIIGVVVLALIVIGLFLKSHLTNTGDQIGRDAVQKPQPVVPKQVDQPRPAEQQPIIEQPIQQPAATAIDQPQVATGLTHKQQAPVERPRQQSATMPETIKDQGPAKVEKKSFAPPSRDNF